MDYVNDNSPYMEWLEKLVEIWKSKNPNGIVDICSENFLWYESPFDNPISTKEQLLDEWQSVLQQENIDVTYEILNMNNNSAIARWHAKYTIMHSREEIELDGIFKIVLNNQGKCTEFRQWYNLK